jgi:hypothetical protein
MGLRTTPTDPPPPFPKTTQHVFLWITGGWGFALGGEGELGRGSSALEFTRVRGTAHLAACAQRADRAQAGSPVVRGGAQKTVSSRWVKQPLTNYDEYDDRLQISNAPFSERTGRGQQMGLRGQCRGQTAGTHKLDTGHTHHH